MVSSHMERMTRIYIDLSSKTEGLDQLLVEESRHLCVDSQGLDRCGLDYNGAPSTYFGRCLTSKIKVSPL